MSRPDHNEEPHHVWKPSARERLLVFFDVRIRLNSSWYFAEILLTWVVYTQITDIYAAWEKLLIGLVGALVFLLSMVVAQYVINLVTVWQGLYVRRVELFVFGGYTAVPADVTHPSLEVFTAATQLAVSVLMAVLFNWIFAARSHVAGFQATVLQLLSFIWYMIAVFHLVPAYPLAAGRAVVAAIWKRSRNRLLGARITSGFGQLLGLGMIGTGLWLLFTQREVTSSLMLAFLGWALQSAARVTIRRLAIFDALRDALVGQVMSREFHAVGPGVTLDQLIREHVVVSGEDYLPVEDGGRLLGVVTARRLRRVRRALWGVTPAAMVMRPVRRISTVRTNESAAHAYALMDQYRVNTLPVLAEDGSPAGVITRDRLMRLARARQVLRV